jgi:hypothetical protein
VNPFRFAFAIAASCACVIAAAQAPTHDPADPLATAPPVQYRSVFDPPAPLHAPPEEMNWKDANADVARFPRGHVDLLKWERSQTPAPETTSAPSTPSTPLAPRPATRPAGPSDVHHQH